MDWKTIGAVAGTITLPFLAILVAMVIMFNQVNARLDSMNGRIDTMNGRIDTMQMEMNRRFDLMQAENQRQHDEIKDVLRIFEGRITRLEENAGIGPENPD